MSELQFNEAKMMETFTCGDKQAQRDAIMALEEFSKTQPQVSVAVEQLLHAGMYVRAATAKAGTLLTGAIYKYDHIEIMTSGSLITTTDDGSACRLDGFNLMPAPSGKKRAAYIIEDTTWITVHMVGDSSIMEAEAVQDAITVETFEDLENFYNEVNQADYLLFCQQIGVPPAQIRYEAERSDDINVDFDVVDYSLYLDDSPIEGTGLFANKSFVSGDEIMPARVKGMRTQAGRFINHAARPNAHFVMADGDLMCVAVDEINAGDEITVNYRDVVYDRAVEGDLCQE